MQTPRVGVVTPRKNGLKGRKTQTGLKRLQDVGIAPTWQELLEDDTYAKIDRLAFDALWEMLAPKLRNELTDLNVLPTFLHARQVLWFILREFRKPGALLGQQSLRDLPCVKFSHCENLVDF